MKQIITRPVVSLVVLKGFCHLLFRYKVNLRYIGQKTIKQEAKATYIKTRHRTIEEFNVAHESKMKAGVEFYMPELPKKLKKEDNCFIFSYAHILFYINRFISADRDIEYSIILSLKMVTNAMFPSNTIKPKKTLNITSIGSSLKNIQFASSNRANYVTSAGKTIPVEITGKSKGKYLCLILVPYTMKNATYPPFNMMLINEKDAKLVAIHDVISDYHKIQNESLN